MMSFTLKHLERMKRLHQLLLGKRTGTPKECAQKLKISDRTLREDIQIIKEWGGKVCYDRKAFNYHYSNQFDLRISYEITVITPEGARKITGGRII